MMMRFTLVRALGLARAILIGAACTACRAFTTAVGQAKANKQYDK